LILYIRPNFKTIKMGMLKEFKDFILTGNVVDFAVAVILAGAIGLVINGFVTDIMMPIIGQFAGGMDFADMQYVLSPAVGIEGEEGFQPANAIRYGAWINNIINLVIVGFVLFMMVRAYNKTRGGAPEAGPSEADLLAEIRDLLQKK